MEKLLHNYGAKLVRVIDGDTIVVRIDLGFSIWLEPSTIRLPRIDAPEIRTRFGKESKMFLEGVFNHSFSIGGQLVVSPCSRLKDKYGRFLCEVWIFGPIFEPMNLSDMMVEENKASFLTGEMGVQRGNDRVIPESQMKQFSY